jgi:hypothetical protein
MKKVWVALGLVASLSMGGCAAMMGYNSQTQGPNHRPLTVENGVVREMTEAEVMYLWKQYNSTVYVNGRVYTVRVR